MDATRSVPRTDLDLGDLAEILEADGPFLTVYLGTDGSVENAAFSSEQRWKALRRQLEADGAPAVAVDAVEAVVADAHHAGATLAAIATPSGLVLVDHFDEPLDRERGSWSSLPDLVPLLRWRQSQVPHVLALADRGGADLIAVRPGRDEIERTVGDDEPERKVKQGERGGRRHRRAARHLQGGEGPTGLGRRRRRGDHRRPQPSRRRGAVRERRRAGPHREPRSGGRPAGPRRPTSPPRRRPGPRRDRNERHRASRAAPRAGRRGRGRAASSVRTTHEPQRN